MVVARRVGAIVISMVEEAVAPMAVGTDTAAAEADPLQRQWPRSRLGPVKPELELDLRSPDSSKSFLAKRSLSQKAGPPLAE